MFVIKQDALSGLHSTGTWTCRSGFQVSSNMCAAASRTVQRNRWRCNGKSLSQLAAPLFCNSPSWQPLLSYCHTFQNIMRAAQHYMTSMSDTSQLATYKCYSSFLFHTLYISRSERDFNQEKKTNKQTNKHFSPDIGQIRLLIFDYSVYSQEMVQTVFREIYVV